MGRLKLLILILFTTNLVASVAFSQDASVLGLPALSSTVGENGEASYSLSLQILVLMTVLTHHDCDNGRDDDKKHDSSEDNFFGSNSTSKVPMSKKEISMCLYFCQGQSQGSLVQK